MNWNGLELPDKPYYSDDAVFNICGDALKILPELPDSSIDLLATDPPYGIGFMGKDWDKALPDKRIWQECYRVLKDGAFAFVMSIPRADCLARMIISLEDAGFNVSFSPIYHAFASGFPKAMNIGKATQAKLSRGGASPKHLRQERQGEKYKPTGQADYRKGRAFEQIENDDKETTLTFPQAKVLDGSYGGFQPKPAVEVVIVAMKPLSEKTFVDQALKNKKGITWLDEGRIPIDEEADKSQIRTMNRGVRPSDDGWGLNDDKPDKPQVVSPQGRFPANLLVSDDALNDGRVTQSGQMSGKHIAPNSYGGYNTPTETQTYPDSGSFSRYFDLDKWFEECIKKLPISVQRTFPFLIVPKASKGEKNKYLDTGKVGGNAGEITARGNTNPVCLKCGGSKYDRGKGVCECIEPEWLAINKETRNTHPTVKPLKLMSYLITLGSREGDIILDPFAGSGTTMLVCQLFGRKCIGIELEEKYCEIAVKRCSQMVMELEGVA